MKNQFLTSQIVLIFSFISTLMLSGFIFDLKSASTIAYYLPHTFPATWYMLIQALFLVGNVPGVVIRDLLVMFCFTVVLLSLPGTEIKKITGVAAMLKYLRNIFVLFRKKVLMIVKDKRSRFILVIPILVQTILSGYVGTYDLNRIEYALLGEDRSLASRELAQRFKRFSYFLLYGHAE